MKNLVVIAFNTGKNSVYLSDQMASHNTTLRKTLKWYRKIAIELVFGALIVNSHLIYKKVTQPSLNITEFRKTIIESLVFHNEENPTTESPELLQTSNTKKEKVSPHTASKSMKDQPIK